MTILAVDDEKIALERLRESIAQANPTASVSGFREPEQALDFARVSPCDVAFLDIEMRGVDGITLAKRLKEVCPCMNIVFVTGYSEYAMDALALYASGYLLKPVTAQAVRRELDHLRFPLPVKHTVRVRIQTFGNFEVFVEDCPLKFRYERTKELLAYLVERQGALCSTAEMIGVLFEDEAGHDAYFKSLRKDLLDTLASVGCGALVVRQWGKLGVDVGQFECDLYDFVAGKAQAINAYRGEFMAQYSWAELFKSDELQTKKSK